MKEINKMARRHKRSDGGGAEWERTTYNMYMVGGVALLIWLSRYIIYIVMFAAGVICAQEFGMPNALVSMGTWKEAFEKEFGSFKSWITAFKFVKLGDPNMLQNLGLQASRIRSLESPVQDDPADSPQPGATPTATQRPPPRRITTRNPDGSDDEDDF